MIPTPAFEAQESIPNTVLYHKKNTPFILQRNKTKGSCVKKLSEDEQDLQSAIKKV